MRTIRLATTLFLCSMLSTVNATARPQTLDKISSLFSTNTQKDVTQKTYHLGKSPSLNITNLHGPIEIYGTDTDRISITVEKAISAKQVSDMIQPVFEQRGSSQLQIASKAKDKAKGSIAFRITIPKTTKQLTLTTHESPITIQNTDATIKSTSQAGSITLTDIQGTTHATTQQRGNITLTNIAAPISALTKNGNIIIHNTNKDINAQTGKGKICVHCKHVPATSTLSLATTSGNIHLSLPEDTNACVQAKTDHGSVTSAHPITIKPFTTQLNTKAWNRFKREIDGTLGSGESVIQLSANHGNIKIHNCQQTIT